MTYGAAADPGGQNVGTRGKDVNKVSVVGVRRAGISSGRSTDSANARGRGRGVVGGAGTVVAGSDAEEDIVADERRSSVVDSSRVATAERHIGDNTVGAVARAGVRSDKVDSGNDTRVRARATIVEDLYSEESSLLGNTVRAGADGTGNVGAVTVAVGVVVTDKGGDLRSAATEVLCMLVESVSVWG